MLVHVNHIEISILLAVLLERYRTLLRDGQKLGIYVDRGSKCVTVEERGREGERAEREGERRREEDGGGRREE